MCVCDCVGMCGCVGVIVWLRKGSLDWARVSTCVCVCVYAHVSMCACLCGCVGVAVGGLCG